MTQAEILAVIEALLFTATEPMGAEDLAAALSLPPQTMAPLMEKLEQTLAERGSGLQVVAVASGWQLCTRPWLAPYLAPARPRPSKLSPAALETLAIIAYRQPITRPEIEAIRGVRAERALASLWERDLICEVGRKDVPGRPILYGTTKTFLQCFGLPDLAALPQNGELKADFAPTP